MRRPFTSFSFFALSGLVLAGCRKDEIKTYRVAKESAPAAEVMPATAAAPAGPVAPSNMAATPVTTADGPGLDWTAPAHWQSRPASAMRKATFVVTGEGGATAELSVTAFPGDVGGKLANVNRWRQQIQLPPITEADLGPALQHLDVGGLHLDVVELIGPGEPPAQRVLGALVPYEGATWFFKLSGPAALVAREQPAFLSFLQSLHPRS
ncbi:MAG: hypothetical protein RIQ79_1257 [Verrucomicrobiota bacterium]